MQTQITRPGSLPSVLLESVGWNAQAVRTVSFDQVTWRSILVTDEHGIVGAVCFTEPDIYPHLVVDTVVMHPERASNAQQLADLLKATLPILGGYAVRFKATRIVFEAASPLLRSLLPTAREDSVTVSIGMGELATEMLVYDLPKLIESFPATPMAEALQLFASPCGRENKSKAGKAAHERHCLKCKEA